MQNATRIIKFCYFSIKKRHMKKTGLLLKYETAVALHDGTKMRFRYQNINFLLE